MASRDKTRLSCSDAAEEAADPSFPPPPPPRTRAKVAGDEDDGETAEAKRGAYGLFVDCFLLSLNMGGDATVGSGNVVVAGDANAADELVVSSCCGCCANISSCGCGRTVCEPAWML